MSPSDDQALEALRTLRAWLGLGAVATAPTTYTQSSLPPGVTRRAFLKRHAARVRAGVAGWTRSGHGRVVTRAAWDVDVAAETAREPHRTRSARLEVVRDLDAELDAALGIRTRRAAS